MTRRRIALALLGLSIVFMIADVYVETNYPVLTEIDLQNSKIPEGASLKILQISDIHDKSFGENDVRLMDLVDKAAPDLIVITGDLADRSTTDFTHISQMISSLNQRVDRIYYVPGNHEQSSRLMKRLMERLSEQGVEVLMNFGSVYEKNGIRTNICGINYPFRKTSREFGPEAEKKALAGALQGIDTSDYTVLLSHSPRIVRSIEADTFDLVLSGHTHGGQVRLPLIGSLMNLDEDFFSGYDKGLFRLGVRTVLYVDSGLGTSILPVRFCNRANVTLFTISGR